MAEIEITLPTVQYGNVKLKAKPEELDELLKTADTLGVAAAMYLNIFTQGFQLGAKMDVSANVKAPLSPGVEEAARLLDEALGGVTELPEHPEDTDPDEYDSAAEAKSAPWDKPAVDSQKKPWETDGVPAPKPVVDEGW